jgi:hypothetical protein
MSQPPYYYKKDQLTRYSFMSTGRRPVKKIVEFIPLNIPGMFNLGFGDLTASNKVDDKANTNNGDIVKVLSTVIFIVKDFLAENPEARIVFAGSTILRTKLYQRILKTYHSQFRKDFTITAFRKSGDSAEEIHFEPDTSEEYLAFIVKRKN